MYKLILVIAVLAFSGTAHAQAKQNYISWLKTDHEKFKILYESKTGEGVPITNLESEDGLYYYMSTTRGTIEELNELADDRTLAKVGDVSVQEFTKPVEWIEKTRK